MKKLDISFKKAQRQLVKELVLAKAAILERRASVKENWVEWRNILSEDIQIWTGTTEEYSKNL